MTTLRRATRPLSSRGPLPRPIEKSAAPPLPSKTTTSRPDITLSVSPSSISEGDIRAKVTVTATRAAKSDAVRIALKTQGGTATDGIDFTTWTFPTLTIADDAISGTAILTFTVWQDTAVEPTETIIVSGTAAGADGKRYACQYRRRRHHRARYYPERESIFIQREQFGRQHYDYGHPHRGTPRTLRRLPSRYRVARPPWAPTLPLGPCLH